MASRLKIGANQCRSGLTIITRTLNESTRVGVPAVRNIIGINGFPR